MFGDYQQKFDFNERSVPLGMIGVYRILIITLEGLFRFMNLAGATLL